MSWRLNIEFSGLAVVEFYNGTKRATAHLLSGGAQREHKPRLYVPADCIRNHVEVASADRSIFGLNIIPVPAGGYFVELDLEDATRVDLGGAGPVTEWDSGGRAAPTLRKLTPADDDDWGCLAYNMDLKALFPGTTLTPPPGSLSFDLPSGELRATAPPLGRQEHEKWEVTLPSAQTWSQSFSHRVALETIQADRSALIGVEKAGVRLDLLLDPAPGRRRAPVTVVFSSECCMAPIGRADSFTLSDFGPCITPLPTVFPSIKGLSNVVCGNRPHCNGLVWLG